LYGLASDPYIYIYIIYITILHYNNTGKNDFAEVFKNLDRSENNSVGLSK